MGRSPVGRNIMVHEFSSSSAWILACIKQPILDMYKPLYMMLVQPSESILHKLLNKIGKNGIWKPL